MSSEVLKGRCAEHRSPNAATARNLEADMIEDAGKEV